MVFFKKRYKPLHHFFFVMLYFAPFTFLYGQETAIVDSLTNKSAKELTSLIISNPKASDMYEAVLLQQKPEDLNLIKACLRLGYFFYGKENYVKSLLYLNRGVVLSEKLKEYSFLGTFYAMKGHVYMRDEDNQNALDAYYAGLAIAQREENIKQEIMANSGLVLVLQRMNQLDKALGIAKHMLQSIKNTPFENARDHVRIFTNINEVYLRKGQYDSVVYYADKGIAMSKSLDFKEGLVDLLIKKGMVYYHTKNYDQAVGYLKNAENIVLKQEVKNDFFPKVNINYFMAGCHYEKKEYDIAITYLNKTIDSLQEKDLDKTPVIQSYLLLANCYGAKKEYEKALFWHNEYLKLNEQYQKNKDKTINKIYTIEAQKLEGEIENLREEQIASENVKKYALLLSGIVMLILITTILVYRKRQKSNKLRFNDLMKKIDVLEGQEQESISKKEETHEIVIDDQKVDEVLKKLNDLEKSEYFLKSDCSLRAIAKKAKTNTTYLSKIINTYMDKNFNGYINDLRIEYALKRLKNDKKFRSFSISSIATEVGYKSDNSFAKHFKAKTGINPSYYIKKIEKLEKEPQL